MDATQVNERLREIAGRFFPQRPTTTLDGEISPPFDISRPNLHDSKAAFNKEMRAVTNALEHASALLDFLLARKRSGAQGHEVAKRVFDFVDHSAQLSLQRVRPESIVSMIAKNAAEAGISESMMLILAIASTQLMMRKQELEGQEAIYWTLKGRAPNHHARTIALRFARVIASETGKKPTFGTARDGGHPSTEFGRALEEVFEILDIRANVRNAAKWAVGQLTESDLKPKPVGLLTGIRPIGNETADAYRNMASKGSPR